MFASTNQHIAVELNFINTRTTRFEHQNSYMRNPALHNDYYHFFPKLNTCEKKVRALDCFTNITSVSVSVYSIKLLTNKINQQCSTTIIKMKENNNLDRRRTGLDNLTR